MIRYIAFDLDGSLLNSKKNIESSSLEGIKQAIKKGMHIVLVSGRHYYEMERYIKEISLHADEDNAVISCDGQYIYNSKGDEIFRFPFLCLNDVNNLCDTYKGNVVVITDKLNYYVNTRPQIINIVRNILKNRNGEQKSISINKKALKKKAIEGIEKVVVITNQIEERIRLREILKNRFSIHVIDDNHIEFENRCVSKWNALSYFLAQKKTSTDEVLYFGDDENDLDCFQNIKNTVAMGNATRVIKQYASVIVCDNDNHGIAEGLRKYGIIEE